MAAAALQKRTRPTKFVARRGRPTSTQSAAIEASILTVARSMFLEHGYANTSMDAVASLAGVSKGTLYARYAEKAELFSAVVSDRLEEWARTGPGDVLTHAGTLPDFLFRFAVTFLRGSRDPEVAAFHRLLNTEARRFPALAGQFYRQGYAPLIARVADELDQLGKAADWRIVDARGLITAFNSALLGWYHAESLLHEVDEDACSAFASRLVGIFIGGRSAW